MGFTIKGTHTPGVHGKSLCARCGHSLIIKGESNKESKQICTQMEMLELGFNVIECNKFDDKSHVDLYDMKKVAWLIETAGHGKSIGFVKPKDRNEEHKKELEEVY